MKSKGQMAAYLPAGSVFFCTGTADVEGTAFSVGTQSSHTSFLATIGLSQDVNSPSFFPFFLELRGMV
jgi:hypothetical protein